MMYKLPMEYDVSLLQEDICKAKFTEAPYRFQNYNPEYEELVKSGASGWKTIRLFENDPRQSLYYQSVSDFPYIVQVIDDVATKVKVMFARLMLLEAGYQIYPHTATGNLGDPRIHIPIITDKKVIFHVDNQSLHMYAGSSWFFYPQRNVHSVVNNSEVDRVHLTIDVVDNDWLTRYKNNIKLL